jgi:hypothetical protein
MVVSFCSNTFAYLDVADESVASPGNDEVNDVIQLQQIRDLVPTGKPRDQSQTQSNPYQRMQMLARAQDATMKVRQV